ncbi:MAG: glycosyl transferase, family 2, partial [Candidatus Solibacter sp.]|nr:glycosyl transferase, family 2 [Candidatus Solibacter sp.]
PELHASELARFLDRERRSEDDCDRRYYGRILRFAAASPHGGTGEWKAEDRPYEVSLKTTVAVTNGFTRPMLPAEFASGFGSPSSAAHALSLLPGFHVSNSTTCSFRFHAVNEGLHRIFLRCRNFDPGVRLRLANQTRTILNAELPITSHDRDCLVIAESVFREGDNVISMTLAGEESRKMPVVVVISCEAMSTV